MQAKSGEMEFAAWEKGIETEWHCQKKGGIVTWQACRRTVETTPDKSCGGVDCWQCGNILNLAMFNQEAMSPPPPKAVGMVILVLSFACGLVYREIICLIWATWKHLYR